MQSEGILAQGWGKDRWGWIEWREKEGQSVGGVKRARGRELLTEQYGGGPDICIFCPNLSTFCYNSTFSISLPYPRFLSLYSRALYDPLIYMIIVSPTFPVSCESMTMTSKCYAMHRNSSRRAQARYKDRTLIRRISFSRPMNKINTTKVILSVPPPFPSPPLPPSPLYPARKTSGRRKVK